MTALLNGGVLATAEVQLPLQGWYRVGRCMPVQVDAGSGPLILRAEGAVDTEVAAGFSGIVPFQILGESAQILQVSSNEIKLHSLSANEKLVALVGFRSRLPADLFPGQSVVSIKLDSNHLLSGPAIAWETLDAAIFDSPIAEKQLLELISLGITVAEQMSEKPDAKYPWQRINDCWVLRADPAGPAGCLGGEIAYSPTLSWHPAMSASLRRQIVLAGILICLSMLATLLIRSKWSIVAMVGVVVISSTLIEIARTGQPSINRAGGQIIVQSPSMTQRDEWQYISAKSEGADGTVLTGRPMLIDVLQAGRINLKLVCDANWYRWKYSLPAGDRLAILARSLEPATVLPAVTQTSKSPLYDLSRKAYLKGATTIKGESARDSLDEFWPSVIVAPE